MLGDEKLARFRKHLGVICESHHLNNLDKTDLYPLLAPVGSDVDEYVNVQYSALLLRTADLLHVTSDRTPSVNYQLVGFSDPKSVEEWDKQLGTFSVRQISRELDESEPDTAIILISADFQREEPLFALQEYITYANDEIRQSHLWAEKSQGRRDGKPYSFPWHAIKSDIQLEGVPPFPLRFELDRGRLLNLLVGHTIYNDPTVAIRELLQNAIDAVRFQHYLDRKKSQDDKAVIGTVRVHWDPEEKILAVEDEGIGMDSYVIKQHLMKVGASYYESPAFETEYKDFSPISRFGIGILACFMVSDDIEIVTCKDSTAHRLRMTSVKSDYVLREIDSGHTLLEGLEPHGTRVKLRLRDTINLEKRTVEDIVRYWIVLPECTVEYAQSGKEPKSLGFSNVRDALEYFHSTTQRDLNSEVLVHEQKESEEGKGIVASYELGFKVTSSSYTPERGFLSNITEDAPMVCIEGIRVSDHLPGFKSYTKRSSGTAVAGLLSVRGSRKFKTIVSRSGLEVDEEYDRVGRLCLKMLFKHIASEVRRISKRTGSPLSQASSASIWLSDSLEKAIAVSHVRDYLHGLRHDLKSIVVEEINEENDLRTPNRLMISPAELNEMQEFWTVESRLVDSLGIISRDLGREVSLNQFLVGLAPDLTELSVWPMLPDAHAFKSECRYCHRPGGVEVSRRHQQTAVRWVRDSSSNGIWTVDVSENRTDEELRTISDYLNQMLPDLSDTLTAYSRGRANEKITDRTQVYIAPIKSDQANIAGVSTRLGSIIAQESGIADLFLDVRSIFQAINKTATDKRRVAEAFALAKCLELSLGRYHHYRSRWGSIWAHLSRERTELESITGIGLRIPERLEKFLDGSDIFDASSYWRDWA